MTRPADEIAREITSRLFDHVGYRIYQHVKEERIVEAITQAIERERARAEGLASALKFYADPNNWDNGEYEERIVIEGDHSEIGDGYEYIEYCGGKRARQALKLWEGK
jgi:hypothetical protein